MFLLAVEWCVFNKRRRKEKKEKKKNEEKADFPSIENTSMYSEQ